MTKKIVPVLRRAAGWLRGRFCTGSVPFAIIAGIVVAMSSSN